jgi:DNA-binding response OmpR family regulator
MTSSNVLLVAHTRRVAELLQSHFADDEHQVTLVTSFSAGRESLDAHPDVLVSEIRLGAFNGLHLALRAQSQGIPAIVFGDTDPVLQREADKIGATYLTPECDDRGFRDALRAARVTSSRERGPRATNAA